jgi:hypothetical protein
MASQLQLSQLLGALAGLFTLLAPCAGTAVLISNTVPRLDSTGQILRVHDGNIVQWEANGLYYWYGMSYGMCKVRSLLARTCPWRAAPRSPAAGMAGAQRRRLLTPGRRPELRLPQHPQRQHLHLAKPGFGQLAVRWGGPAC